MPTMRLKKQDGTWDKVPVLGSYQAVLAANEPVLCEVVVNPDYTFSPKLSARKLPDGTMISPTLEDMFPFLDRDEFERNMIHE